MGRGGVCLAHDDPAVDGGPPAPDIKGGGFDEGVALSLWVALAPLGIDKGGEAGG